MNLLIEYDAKKDRLAYRRIEDWESKKWPVKYLSKPYTLGEFFRVFWKNIVGASKANPEKVQYESHQIQLAKETTNETTIENQNLKIAFLGDLMPTKGRKWVPVSYTHLTLPTSPHV